MSFILSVTAEPILINFVNVKVKPSLLSFVMLSVKIKAIMLSVAVKLLMLTVKIKPIMLSVVRPSAVMLSVIMVSDEASCSCR